VKKNNGGTAVASAVDVDFESAKINEAAGRSGCGAWLGHGQAGHRHDQNEQHESFQDHKDPPEVLDTTTPGCGQ
jgi:hypothetical protein